MPIDPITMVSVGSSILGGIFGGGAARRRARAARRARNALYKKLSSFLFLRRQYFCIVLPD